MTTGHDGVFLGFSLGRPYYSRSRVAAYLAWAKVNAPQFAVLIADDIYADTLSILRQLRNVDALERARQMGDNAASLVMSTSVEHGVPVKIIRWRDFESNSKYQMILSTLYKEYCRNILLQNSIRRQLRENLGTRLDVAGVSQDASIKNHASITLERYLINEIAGLIYISEFTEFSTEIYPGADLFVLGEIYSGNYRLLETIGLSGRQHRRFMNITIDEGK